MFISKKRWQALVKRVADLEGRVQSQQNIASDRITLSGNVVMKIKTS